MGGFLKSILHEIQLQMTDTPAYASKYYAVSPRSTPQLEYACKQLEKTLADPSKKLIFLIGPNGGGKTSYIQYFLKKNPSLSYDYKSFVKIRDIDFAFLHLTSLWGRLFFIVLSLISTFVLVKMLPPAGALPFLLALGYFFTKSAAGLIYIFYETLHNLFSSKTKLVVMEDLGKSSLSLTDKWALLANLWLNKRTYLISLGYPLGEKGEKLKILEPIMRLKGAIVEIGIREEENIQIVKDRDPDFPFHLPEKAHSPSERAGLQFPGWLSLFTPQELLMVKEQVSLRLSQFRPASSIEEKRQMIYVQVCLDLLSEKIGLNNGEVVFHPSAYEILVRDFEGLSDEKKYYFQSFVDSIDPELGIKMLTASPAKYATEYASAQKVQVVKEMETVGAK